MLTLNLDEELIGKTPSSLAAGDAEMLQPDDLLYAAFSVVEAPRKGWIVLMKKNAMKRKLAFNNFCSIMTSLNQD